MQTGFYSNTGGMVTQFSRLNVVSNNLANLNTNGFKRDDVVIGDFMRLFKEDRDILPHENHTKAGSKFLNRSIVRVPQIVEEYTDQSLGAVTETGNSLDLAFRQKDLYFAIKTPVGIRYTRDGNFMLNEDGEITTNEGYPLMSKENSPIRVQRGMDISITSDGRVYVRNQETLNANGENGEIKIVTFENPKYLKKIGDNLFSSEKPEVLMEGDNLIKQGFLEKSNVNAVSEMTSLIEINRLVGMDEKVMDTHMNELNQDAITKLGSLRG